jgi:hypothetical protein
MRVDPIANVNAVAAASTMARKLQLLLIPKG